MHLCKKVKVSKHENVKICKMKVKVQSMQMEKLILKYCTNTATANDTNTEFTSLQTGFCALFMWTWSENVIINCCSMVQWCNCASCVCAHRCCFCCLCTPITSKYDFRSRGLFIIQFLLSACSLSLLMPSPSSRAGLGSTFNCSLCYAQTSAQILLDSLS